MAALVFALCGSSSFGEVTPRAAAVVNALEARYHGAKTLKAVFLEQYREGRSVTRVESGTAYFSKPGRMRWEYVEPEQKFFLSDGKTVWFYVPSDHTVTRSAMKESSDWRTPLALLTGKADLGKICSKIDVASDATVGTAGDVMLRCTPKAEVAAAASRNPDEPKDVQALTPDQQGDIRDILLEVNPKDGWLASVVIKQSGGIEMEYRFGKWEENMDLPEVMFHFSAPKGVAIVDQGGV
jgi:outer membrane lipoprotein carrier protein